MHPGVQEGLFLKDECLNYENNSINNISNYYKGYY